MKNSRTTSIYISSSCYRVRSRLEGLARGHEIGVGVGQSGVRGVAAAATDTVRRTPRRRQLSWTCGGIVDPQLEQLAPDGVDVGAVQVAGVATGQAQ